MTSKKTYKDSERSDRIMAKKILMIWPKFPATYWGFQYAVPFLGKKAAIPPLGLLTVAALLPNDWKTKVVDMNFQELTDELIQEADIVFISAMLAQQISFTQVIQRCKKYGKKVVAGGPYPTSLWNAPEMGDVDHIILGEAEGNFPQFLSDLERGGAQHIYNKVAVDITKSPRPLFDLLDMRAYHSMAVQISRGCRFSCEFCDIIELFGRKVRMKTIEQVIAEFDFLFELGWKGSLFIVDDNFIGNKQRVKRLLGAIVNWQKKHDYPFELYTETSVDLAEDDELLDLMVAAGFTMVFWGIETPSKEALEKAGKIQNIKGASLSEKIQRVQEKGIEVAGGFIIGFDDDKPDIFDQMISFIQETGVVLAMVGLLNALPGTKLWRRLEKERRLKNGNSSGVNTHDFEINFDPKMDPSTLIFGYKKVIAHIYSPEHFFDRCLTYLRCFKPHQHSVRGVGLSEIRALVMSLGKQTFSSYGNHYIAYLIKAILINYRMFPEAVRQAVMGYHLFRITDETLAVDNFKTILVRVLNGYKKDLQEACGSLTIEKKITELQKKKDDLLAKWQKEYLKIHKDFRNSAEVCFQNFKDSLNAAFEDWQKNLQNAL